MAGLGCRQTAKESGADAQEPTTVSTAATAKSLYVDLDGNAVALADYKGKRVLLNFWATWCTPCIQEMPSLLRAQAILEKENYVFLLASEDTADKIMAFAEKKQFDFTYLRLTGALAQQQVYGLPTTFIYNEAGEKVDQVVGGVVWDAPEVIQKLKEIE